MLVDARLTVGGHKWTVMLVDARLTVEGHKWTVMLVDARLTVEEVIIGQLCWLMLGLL
jgi:hypothetical protein